MIEIDITKQAKLLLICQQFNDTPKWEKHLDEIYFGATNMRDIYQKLTDEPPKKVDRRKRRTK